MAFTDLLFRVLATERRAQAFEQEGLGALPIGTLKGKRLERRQRINQDRERFSTRVQSLPRAPLAPPTAGEGRALRSLESVVVARVARACEASRNPRRLKTLQSDLKEFLDTENWAARDHAVSLRDELIENELAWSELVARSIEIVTHGLPDEDLRAMLTKLDRLSPETADAKPSIVTQLINDPQVRAAVMAQLLAVLQAPSENSVPEESDTELLAALPALQKDLVVKSGLAETMARSMQIDQELLEIKAKLNDQGVHAATPEERDELTGRQAELLVERNHIKNVINTTPPDQEAAEAMAEVQDKLIRRRMFDLGSRAALFGHRADEIASRRAYKGQSPNKIWTHLEDQAALISALDSARPAPNPLQGVHLDPTSLAPPAPITKASLSKPLPKPKSKGKKKKKKKKKGGKRP